MKDNNLEEEILLLKELYRTQRYLKVSQIARLLNIPIPIIKKLLNSLELKHLIVVRRGTRVLKPYEMIKKYLMRERPIKSIYTEDEPEYRISRRGIFFLSKFNFI